MTFFDATIFFFFIGNWDGNGRRRVELVPGSKTVEHTDYKGSVAVTGSCGTPSKLEWPRHCKSFHL